MADRAYLQRLTQELIDQGKLIEAGFVSLRLVAIQDNAPKEQLDEMRSAFFAGAQHVFGSVISMLDPGEEPTDADLRRLSLIHEELQGFIANFRRQHGLTDAPETAPKPAPKPEPHVAQTLGDAPIEERYRAGMNDLAQFLDGFFNGDKKGKARETGFMLLVCAFGDQGRANYISNMDRHDVTVLLKEQVKRFEGQPEITGHA